MRIVCYTKVKQSKGASPPKAIHYMYSVNLENGTQVPARPEKCMLFGYLQSVVYATRRRAGERVKIVARFTRIMELRGDVQTAICGYCLSPVAREGDTIRKRGVAALTIKQRSAIGDGLPTKQGRRERTDPRAKSPRQSAGFFSRFP